MSTDLKRCRWAENVPDNYRRYHDEEWGSPVYDDEKLFEMLLLESFQAGLSWLTILNKRENFRAAFDDFDYCKIAAYGNEKTAALMSDAGIIRNRRKIAAAIQNARVFQEIQTESGSFSAYLWGFTDGKVIKNSDGTFYTHSPLSDSVSEDLIRRGMRFVGTTIIYSYLQAVGVIDDHEPDCFHF